MCRPFQFDRSQPRGVRGGGFFAAARWAGERIACTGPDHNFVFDITTDIVKGLTNVVIDAGVSFGVAVRPVQRIAFGMGGHEKDTVFAFHTDARILL